MSPINSRSLIAVAVFVALASCSSSPDEPVQGEPKPKVTPTAPSPTGVDRIALKKLEDRRVKLDSPDWMASGFGSLWVKRDDGAVVRLSPKGKVLATINAGNFQPPVCQGIGVSDEAVWACAALGTIIRIDPETNEVAAEVDVSKLKDQGRLTSGNEHVWLLTEDGRELVGLSEDTNQLDDPIELGSFCTDTSDAAPGGTLWVTCSSDGILLRVDLEKREVTGKVSDLPLATNVSVGRFAWVGFDGGVAQVDPASLEVTMIHAGNPRLGSIRASADSVWIREPDNFLTRLDPTSGAVREVVTAEDLPSGGDVIEFDGAVWASAYDDAAVVRLTPPG